MMRPRARQTAGVAGWVRLGLIIVIAASLGGSAMFLLNLYARGAVGDVKVQSAAQLMLQGVKIPEMGQAGVNALLDGGDGRALRDGRAPYVERRKRVIVLSDGEGRWNTGVWPAWGGEDPRRSVLSWAAAGVVVNKVCSVACEVTRDQTKIAGADAVVMELVNHPKFGIPRSVPIPWPPRRGNPKAARPGAQATRIPEQLPLTVLFYYEAAASYPDYTMQSSEVMAHVDLTMTPDQSSTLPVTMACLWGRQVYDYVKPLPAASAKQPGRLISYFNEHGIAPSHRGYIDKLFELAGDKMHSYVHMANRPLPAEAGGDPFQLSTRLDFVGTYRFVLVTESVVEDDWVEPDLSQAFLAGAVPVYLGAPTVHSFVPGPRSFVHIRDFPAPEALWAYLASFDDDSAEGEARYRAEFFSWRQHALATYLSDEQGQTNPVGAGHGVMLQAMVPQVPLRAALERWAPRPGPDGAPPPPFAEAAAVVAAAQQLEFAAAGGPVRHPLNMDFDKAAAAAWRSFRRRLDQCVHNAECRLCELVTLLTT